MQIHVPATRPNFDMTKWTRVRMHHATYLRVAEPVQALYGTEHDPWSYDRETNTYTYSPDDVWLAACEETDRRFDAYMRKVAF